MIAICGLICYDGRSPAQKASGAGMSTVVINNSIESKPLIVSEQQSVQSYVPQQPQQPPGYHSQQPQQQYIQQQPYAQQQQQPMPYAQQQQQPMPYAQQQQMPYGGGQSHA
jgi:hypothetical protein